MNSILGKLYILVGIAGVALIFYFAAQYYRERTVTGELIQCEKKQSSFTGEKFTILTLRDDVSGANCFLAISGHSNPIELGDRIRATYSMSHVSARETDPLGNPRVYYQVISYSILLNKKSRH